MRDVLSEIATRTVKRLVAAHGGHNVRILRSGGSARPLLLVDMDQGRNLFDLVALNEELVETLGVEVDVLTEGSLSPYLRDAVLARAVAL